MQRVEQTPTVTRVLGDIPGAEFGAVLFTSIDERNADAVIAGEIRYFESQGRPFEWKVFGHDKPADLGERLALKYFRPGDAETLMCLEPAGPLGIAPPVGMAIKKLARPDDLSALDAFDTDESLLTELRGELAATPDRLSVYCAYLNGKPVARGWIRYYPGCDFADLWGGFTIPDLRGRGIYKSLVAARADEALTRKVRFLTTDAMPTSRPILERLGARPLTTTTGYLWMPM